MSDEPVSKVVIEERDRILSQFHEVFGVCGHCGKRDCMGRKSWSVLPDKLEMAMVLKIVGDIK